MSRPQLCVPRGGDGQVLGCCVVLRCAGLTCVSDTTTHDSYYYYRCSHYCQHGLWPSHTCPPHTHTHTHIDTHTHIQTHRHAHTHTQSPAPGSPPYVSPAHANVRVYACCASPSLAHSTSAQFADTKLMRIRAAPTPSQDTQCNLQSNLTNVASIMLLVDNKCKHRPNGWWQIKTTVAGDKNVTYSASFYFILSFKIIFALDTLQHAFRFVKWCQQILI